LKSYLSSSRSRIHEIIFEAETPAGKAFDVVLLAMIVLSVLIVSLESVDSLSERFRSLFFYLEWGFTLLFTLEYLLRIYSVSKPWNYISSFYGIVDLLSILPTYLSLIVSGSQYLITIRALRLLRVFRIFKLGSYLGESQVLISALKASRTKITVFLGGVLASVIVVGSTMYLVEAEADSGFTSIPRSIYWAIVTITTVGYGDIAPATALGQFLSAILMIMGYGIIAVPTGIVSVEIAQAHDQAMRKANTVSCENCARSGHDSDAEYCKYCGQPL
jgi:voltage-gated potassium channel